MKLRRITALTLGLFVSTALSGVALSADVEQPYQHDWTGFYVGGHVGYGWIDLNGSHESENNVPGDFENGDGPFDLDDDDFLGGIQIGANYQIDQFFVGIEGDLAFASLNDKITNTQSETVSFDTDLVATLRARAGLALDDILLFGTIGVAWTDTNHTVESGDPDPVRKNDIDLDDIGLAVGGGAEYALDERWSIKADALYLLFDDKEKTENLVTDSEVGDFIELEDLFIVRVGVNFHL